ncbi:hypothetical protein AJ88_35355 [Mesorhizobium amorphae CCBAU 01583]|nr:hypothetical protein AJ88_35355 [Mesorhizobium amorphae CCBAU 01583]
MLTNYSPPSHKLTFLRALAKDQDRRLFEAWPREQQRHRAWFNTLNEAYVKARYSKHYLISEEALVWLGAPKNFTRTPIRFAWSIWTG